MLYKNPDSNGDTGEMTLMRVKTHTALTGMGQNGFD